MHFSTLSTLWLDQQNYQDWQFPPLPQLTPYHFSWLFFYFQRALNRASSFCPLISTKHDNPSPHSFSGQKPLRTIMSSSVSLWKKHIKQNMLISLIVFSLSLRATLYEQGSRVLSQVHLEKSNSSCQWKSSVSGCHNTAVLWSRNNSAMSALCIGMLTYGLLMWKCIYTEDTLKSITPVTQYKCCVLWKPWDE